MILNDGELKQKVNVAMYDMMVKTGVITPVDVMMAMGILDKKDYESWRNGKLPYLERACKVNLRKLSTLMKEMRAFAKRNNLKASWTYYHGWGKARDVKLRFSKTGNDYIEQQYATHYISQKTLDRLKAEKKEGSAAAAE